MLSTSAFGQNLKTERQGEPDIITVNSEDKEMNEAIRKSRLSFSDFVTVLRTKRNSYTNYSVKMPFNANNEVEHIWLVDIELRDEKLYGTVGNLPDNVTKVKLGDIIEIDSSKISDWFYLDGNRLIGGLSIRLFRNRMNNIERKEFDQESGMKID